MSGGKFWSFDGDEFEWHGLEIEARSTAEGALASVRERLEEEDHVGTFDEAKSIAWGICTVVEQVVEIKPGPQVVGDDRDLVDYALRSVADPSVPYNQLPLFGEKTVDEKAIDEGIRTDVMLDVQQLAKAAKVARTDMATGGYTLRAAGAISKLYSALRDPDVVLGLITRVLEAERAIELHEGERSAFHRHNEQLAARVLELEAPGECQSIHKLRAELAAQRGQPEGAINEHWKWFHGYWRRVVGTVTLHAHDGSWCIEGEKSHAEDGRGFRLYMDAAEAGARARGLVL